MKADEASAGAPAAAGHATSAEHEPPAHRVSAEDERLRVDLGWFAGSTSGRVLLTAVLAFLSYSLVVWNLPSSEVRAELRPGIRPVVNALAIDQSWSVFAPNPTTLSLAVEADVYLATGEVVRYTFPHGDDLIGAYREYRWRKWERRVRLDSNDHLWKHTAEWVREQFDEEVSRVVLVRRFSDTPEPGSGDERVWESVEFFEISFGAGDGAGEGA